MDKGNNKKTGNTTQGRILGWGVDAEKITLQYIIKQLRVL